MSSGLLKLPSAPQGIVELGADCVRLVFSVMCRSKDLVHVVVVLVVSHQHSVHVTPAVVKVIELCDVVWQVICVTDVEVADGVVGVLAHIRDHWEKIPSVLELMEAVLPFGGITQSHLVVVQAPVDVPAQQPETVARSGAPEATGLQLLF